MTAVLVDSNILLDIVAPDEAWSGWSSEALARALEESPLVINPLIYAEVSVRFTSMTELDEQVPPNLFRREPLPYEAGFVAGKCFVEYRRRGGRLRSPMPDFYIGAHAQLAGYRLLTRDPSRYRSYFPKLALIAPG